MPAASRTPWTVDKSWGDPMILTLLLLALLLSHQVLARRMAPAPPAHRVSLAGRLEEASLLAPQILRFRGRSLLKPTDWEKAGTRVRDPWDRAMVAVLAADRGAAAVARSLATGAPESAQRALRATYDGGPPMDSRTRLEVLRGLESTHAGRLLEARLLDLDGANGDVLRASAQQALAWRVRTLAWLGSMLFLAGVGGLAFALFLFVGKHQLRPVLMDWNLGGRATALVLLAWFTVLLLSGSLASLLVLPLPGPWRLLGLPLAYAIHAGFGLFLLAGFSGSGIADWRQKGLTLPWGRILKWSVGSAGLAVMTVFLVGMAMAPILPRSQPAQKELLEALAAARGLSAVTLIFLTVSVLAPAFEELLFRGFLLSWMAARWGKIPALLGSSLLFGAIHLAPGGMPTLSALGLVLGLAYLLTGDLRVCMLVHGLWNGSVFFFTRWVMG